MALAPSFIDQFCCNFTQMFSMKNIMIKFKFQLSGAKDNVKDAILRNMLLAIQCFHLWTDFDITSYKFSRVFSKNFCKRPKVSLRRSI